MLRSICARYLKLSGQLIGDVGVELTYFLAHLDKVQESYFTTPGVGVGVGGGGISKKFNVKVFLCDGQGTVRRAILFL